MSKHQQLASYDRHRTYDWNYEHAPDPVEVDVPVMSGEWHFCGLRVSSPLGVPAGCRGHRGQRSVVLASGSGLKEKLMEKFTVHSGTGIPLRRSNVDTDQIIPAEYLKRISRWFRLICAELRTFARFPTRTA